MKPLLASPMGMNKVHGLATIALALALSTGCSKLERSMDSASAPAAAVAAPTGAGGANKEAAGGALKAGVASRALIVTLDMSLVVVDVDATRARIKGQVERAGGYIADASTADKHAVLDVRVPASSVGSIHDALRGMGEVTNDSEKVQDVTEEKADLEARLHNARVQEKRVLEIMTTKTGAISEVISAETELARIRESIERMEAQKRTLDSKIDLATIHITLGTQMPPVEPPVPAWKTPGKSIGEAAAAGGRAAAAFVVYALMAFVASAPFTLPLLAAVLGVVYAIKNKKKKQLAAMMQA